MTDKLNGKEENLNSLAPPTKTKLEVKEKVSLVFEVVWLVFVIGPQYIFLAIFRKIFPPPEKSLRGQVALVTGAGRGLGKGLALALAKEGCKVAVADVNKAGAEETAEEINTAGGLAKAYYCNVAKREEIKDLRAAIEKDIGPVDLLINNAGLIFMESFDDISDEEFQAVINVNLISHFRMAKEFLPPMKERNFGHIVAIASVASYRSNIANGTAYGASKFGVRGFMEALRADLSKTPGNNIKTTTVCPYFINTSSEYVSQWNIRLPPMSISEAVEGTIAGIKRDEVCFTIPQILHYLAHFTRFLPDSLCDLIFNKIFYFSIIPYEQKQKENMPVTKIIKDLTR